MGRLKPVGIYVVVFVAGCFFTHISGFFSRYVWDYEAGPKITFIQDPSDNDEMWFDVNKANLSGVKVKIETGPTDGDFRSLHLVALSDKPDVAVSMHYQFDDDDWGDMFTYYVHYRRDDIDRVNVWNDFDVDGQFDTRLIAVRGAGELKMNAYIDDRWVAGTLNDKVFSDLADIRYRFEDGKGWVRE
ncbi:MAG: hypothetical protein R3C45_09785 [Phycisphaerales bacterium]